MLHFEKALYENPQQDLNAPLVGLRDALPAAPRPPGAHEPDWASKPHFTIAPVYYHNYLLGELFAAQLRHVLAAAGRAPRTDRGAAFRRPPRVRASSCRQRVFRPGRSQPWPEFVRRPPANR